MHIGFYGSKPVHVVRTAIPTDGGYDPNLKGMQSVIRYEGGQEEVVMTTDIQRIADPSVPYIGGLRPGDPLYDYHADRANAGASIASAAAAHAAGMPASDRPVTGWNQRVDQSGMPAAAGTGYQGNINPNLDSSGRPNPAGAEHQAGYNPNYGGARPNPATPGHPVPGVQPRPVGSGGTAPAVPAKALYHGAPVTVIRDATFGDAGFTGIPGSPGFAPQSWVRMADGSEKAVLTSDITH